ncbi:MAG: tetratricopeptide repeat protein [Treponema sp.]|jgi:tetratricopeptide (TPR) repeat protein|nr:tetratricopeptide repeat protein [Treponema sp.]
MTQSRRDRVAFSPLYPALALVLLISLPLGAQNRSGPEYWYEQGRAFMLEEDWYAASEALMECLRLNPAHAEANAALAECYYGLGEFSQALSWVRKARGFARGNMGLANLEASTLAALGRLDAAQAVVDEILAREPYNREALFAAGELDLARGQSARAVERFRDAVRRYPDDRRLLISLALVLSSLGEEESARSYIERAMSQRPEDYRVYYYAAYLDAQAGRLPQAIRYAEQALYYRPGYGPALALLGSLRYRTGRYEDALSLADTLIARDREESGAWYLKALALRRLGRGADAIRVLAEARNIDPGDEFILFTLEDMLISESSLEDPRRARWASLHFDRGRDFRSRNLGDEAIFEYRRGLRLNPYARDRREYAELLRLQGYPARYLEELRVAQDQGHGDRNLNDAVETYSSLLSGSLFNRWQVNPVEVSKPHWKVAVFSIAAQSSFFHADAALAAASLVRDILIHQRNIGAVELALAQPSFSQAFRAAREAGADYFLLVSVSEGERDLSLTGELFVARTGAPAWNYPVFRTGGDRLRNAARGLAEGLARALPLRGEILNRRQAQALMDKGRSDGVVSEMVFDVVRKGGPEVLNEGIGLGYDVSDIVGTFTVDAADEEVSAGTLSRSGFFDRISVGDELILRDTEAEEKTAAAGTANPELRRLLRMLR